MYMYVPAGGTAGVGVQALECVRRHICQNPTENAVRRVHIFAKTHRKCEHICIFVHTHIYKLTCRRDCRRWSACLSVSDCSSACLSARRRVSSSCPARTNASLRCSTSSCMRPCVCERESLCVCVCVCARAPTHLSGVLLRPACATGCVCV